MRASIRWPRGSFRAAVFLLLPLLAGRVGAQQLVRLHGTVVDAATGGALVGAVVAVGGRLAYTDGRGRFLLGGVPDTAAVVVTRVGYEAARARATVEPLDLRLAPAAVLLNQLTVVVPRSTLGRGSALAVQNVERATLEARGVSSLAEALETVPGVAVSRPGAWGAKAVLRGLGGERVAVLVNGNRVSRACTFGMDQGPATIEPSTVQRVEILSGPGSALYGSGNVGGVINIVTGDAVDSRPLTGEVRLRASTAIPGLGLGGSIAATRGRVSLAAALDGESYGDYRIPSQTVAGSGFTHGTGSADLGILLRSGERLAVHGQWYEGRHIGWPAMGDASIPFQRRRTAAVDYGRQLGRTVDAFSARAYLQRLDHHMVMNMRMAMQGGTAVTTTSSSPA